MPGRLLAPLIGAVAGFVGLWLRELGWILLAATLSGLTVAYARQGRTADIGWLYLAAGGVPFLVLARNVLTTLVDPAVEVGFDTYALLAAALVLASVGGAILVASRRPD